MRAQTKPPGDCDSEHSDIARVFLRSRSLAFEVHRMERFLLLWDEIDDFMGTSRYYMKNTAIAIWSSVRPR
jgi:hypothetical protein